VIQRKILTPNDFIDTCALATRLIEFQGHYENYAKPFEWRFSRQDLMELLAKISGSARHPLDQAG
jgi:hypothetical protein